MIPIQNIFTGQGVGTVYTDTSRTDRAVENFYRQQYEMNKNMLLDAQARQKQFLDYTSIEPIQAISKQHQLMQADAIKGFEKDALSLYTKKGGRLNMEDQMMLQGRMNELKSLQNKIKVNQDQYQRAEAEFFNHPYDYDRDKWQKAQRDFQDTGDFNAYAALRPSKGNVMKTYAAIPKELGWDRKITESAPEFVGQSKAGDSIYQKKIYYANQDGTPASGRQMRNRFKTAVVGAEQQMNMAIMDFEDLVADRPDIANEYLLKAESDNIKGASAEEMNNAVLNYAADKAGYLDTDDPVVVESTSLIRRGRSDTERQPTAEEKKKVAMSVVDGLETTHGKGKGILFTSNIPIKGISSDVFDYAKGEKPPSVSTVFLPTSILNGLVEGQIQLPTNETEKQWVSEDDALNMGITNYETDAEHPGQALITKKVNRSLTATAPLEKMMPYLQEYYNPDKLKELLSQIDNIRKTPASASNKSGSLLFIYSKEQEEGIKAFMKKNNISSREKAIQVLTAKGYL